MSTANGPRTAPRPDSVDALPQPARRAARDLVLCLADSKRILGLRYSDWILGAPELEAGIAASGMAQDEWGHARILYSLLKDFGDDPQEIEHARAPSAYANLETLDAPFATWPEFVAGNVLVDTALTVQLEAIVDGHFAPLAARLPKQIEEERFHFAHGVGWLRRLAGASSAARKELGAALRRVWTPALRWFGAPGAPSAEALVDAGVMASGPEELRRRFLERLGPTLHEGRLGLVSANDVGWTAKAKLSWSKWDESRRRASGTGPDDEVVARARGDRNRMFLMD